jgi:hypothetical protein
MFRSVRSTGGLRCGGPKPDTEHWRIRGAVFTPTLVGPLENPRVNRVTVKGSMMQEHAI